MTLTRLLKIAVVLCGRFEFIFYALQLLDFKWISRYEKTNAYILIIYLLCINITDGSYITRYTHLYLLLLAQHLISSHWLSKTHWSRWWKETASILWKEDGIRSASWQSWRWMEGVCSKNCWRQWQTGISHETGNSYQRPCEIASQQRTFLLPPQTHWRAS